jgi:hypothetical protein
LEQVHVPKMFNQCEKPPRWQFVISTQQSCNIENLILRQIPEFGFSFIADPPFSHFDIAKSRKFRLKSAIAAIQTGKIS